MGDLAWWVYRKIRSYVRIIGQIEVWGTGRLETHLGDRSRRTEKSMQNMNTNVSLWSISVLFEANGK